MKDLFSFVLMLVLVAVTAFVLIERMERLEATQMAMARSLHDQGLLAP